MNRNNMSLVYHKFNRPEGATDPVFEHLKSLTLAACHSQAKYSDYSDEQVVNAYETATDMIFVAVATTSPLFVVPLAVVLMSLNTITLTFTLPAGKGRKIVISLIEEAVNYLRQKEMYDSILCQTHGFGWITSSAAYNKFEPLAGSSSLYRTYVLRFNVDPITVYDTIEPLVNISSDKIKKEPLIENGSYDYIKQNGGPMLDELLNQNILTEKELSRSRFDVRVGLLRAGQSQNPLGIHCDFFNPDKINNGVADRLKILFVTNAYSETRLYTKPCITTMAHAKDWYKIVRQPEVDLVVKSNDYIIAKRGQPIMFSDRTLHQATALTKEQLPPNSEVVWRYMMRIVVYPESRADEAPKPGQGCVGVPQVYMMTEQEM